MSSETKPKGLQRKVAEAVARRARSNGAPTPGPSGRKRTRTDVEPGVEGQTRLLLCDWWIPVANSNRIAALSSPKATPGYSVGLEEREPGRFLRRGARVVLVEKVKIGRYFAWRLSVEGDHRTFTAYEPELIKFSECVRGLSAPTATADETDHDGALKLAAIAAIMTDAGMPMSEPAVSRQLDSAILNYLVVIAERVFFRSITREELELRAQDPESWQSMKDALREFLSRN